MSIPSLENPSRRANPIERWLLAVLALSAWIVGYVGCVQYEMLHAGHVNHFSEVYHSLQLLTLHSPHMEVPVPAALQWGRWLGALFFFWALAKIVRHALRADLLGFSARWRRGHVVVCGLGELGLQLARDARQAGKRPVVIERDAAAPGVQDAHDLGIPVIVGDGCHPAVLARAGAHRATEIFAVSGDDETNLGIAVMVEKLRLDSRATAPAQSWLFFEDPASRVDLQLRPLLQRRDPLYHINPRALDLDEVRARRAFAALPVAHLRFAVDEPKRPLFVIIGFGSVGEALVRQAALLAHFPGSGKLQILAVDAFAGDMVEHLRQHCPNFDHVADLELLNGTLDAPAILTRVQQVCVEAHQDRRLLAAAVCHNGDNIGNTRQALRLAEATAPAGFPVLVFLSHHAGMTQLLGIASAATPANRLIAFGMAEDIRNYTTLCDEVQDRLARAFHELYLEQRATARQQNPAEPRRPAELPWDELPETFRDASRALADHLRFKLFSVGRALVPAAQAGASSATLFTEEQIVQLSELEHARWCAERWLAGWTYAPVRNDEARQHNLLVPWRDLAQTERFIDRHMMENALAALGRAGFGAEPMPPPADH
jgi:voltage-gated potassium channel Kch